MSVSEGNDSGGLAAADEGAEIWKTNKAESEADAHKPEMPKFTTWKNSILIGMYMFAFSLIGGLVGNAGPRTCVILSLSLPSLSPLYVRICMCNTHTHTNLHLFLPFLFCALP